jgi:NAD(P)-dependent dehydrogenase (short-subunit alcohol dehydrogenase family)
MQRSPVTLVTGASSGIGCRIAVQLSTSRRLLLHGRDAGRLERTRGLCQRSAEHRVWTHDLRDIDAIDASLTQVIERDALAVEGFVHSAGTLEIRPLRLLELSAARQIMDVNFMSAAEILRLLVRKKRSGGHLRGAVFISSTASQFGARGFSLYSASKGALDAFMRAMAVELAPDVRVNSVLPGAVSTAMTGPLLADPELLERIRRDHPLGLGEPSDIAAAVEFLLSDQARWITGQQLVVDGGRTVDITAGSNRA